MNTSRKLWLLLGAVLLGTFLLLGFFGREVYRQAPPIPEKVVVTGGTELFTRDDILTGQQAWQSMGGQHVGSIWGHGAMQAPDWSADWLHREVIELRNIFALRFGGAKFAELSPGDQSVLSTEVQEAMRRNTYDEQTGVLTISAERATAIASVSRYYEELFSGAPERALDRQRMALKEVTIPDPERRQQLNAFFFWASWVCATERPGSAITYTNNWPHEPLIGNRPTSANLLWSILSVVLLLAGVGALVWYQAFRRSEEPLPDPPHGDPFERVQLTPSMKAVGKYLVVVSLLLLVQCFLGAVTAHYTVEGQAFFGFPLSEWLPYSVTRTWHMQLAVFWIATAFLAAGLFLGPIIGGREPRFQKLGVDILFAALIVVVGGSMLGQWFSVQQAIPLDFSFLFGHQGYEFVELGRVFQIGLFVGLGFWLVLMLRALWPALSRRDDGRTVTLLFAGSAACIGLFYGAGFGYASRTHLSIMEFWRWWVVHLWVEGFMEVFTTAALAVLFSRLGLVRPASAGRAILLSTAIFLLGGVPGTFHHLYFAGTPVSILAIGATFSALEVVPLVLIGLEAAETARMARRAPWVVSYRWPIRFFVAVAFWNMVGAGIFGFLINPPIALYYAQGLNTTPVHSHGALFGVYGFLALGLLLVVLRRLRPHAVWNEALLRLTFWSFNVGLVLMLLLSLLPVGLIQLWASMEHGFWYARSPEFIASPLLQGLRWARVVGDVLFLIGVVTFVAHVFRSLRPGTSRATGVEGQLLDGAPAE
jgi:nitric oxide reductase subunit B